MSRRIDATLIDERIVDAARRLLADQPDAGMDQLAAAAGVGRATLYRRFSSRDELMEELGVEARREALHALKSARPEEGSASEALERMFASLLPIADRFAFVNGATRKRGADPRLAKPWLTVIERGQESGEFSSDLPASWWLAVIRTHFREAAAALSAGAPSDIAATAARALLRGLSA